MKNYLFVIVFFLMASCYSKNDLIGKWVIFESKSSNQGRTKILKLEEPFEFQIINDTLAFFLEGTDNDTIFGSLNSDFKTLAFPSDCCAACFEYKQAKDKLFLENYLGTESIAHKIKVEK